MREIYLDNAATTPCDPRVLKAMAPFWSKVYGNPSSFNDSGRQARGAVEQSRKKIARILGARNQEIIFASSATEANNLAVFGVAEATKNKSHIITTSIEHHSILEPIKQLGKEGVEITYLPVNKEGIINLEDFKKALKPETLLISIIYANNEIGSVQPIKKIGKIVKEFKKNGGPLYFHIDASQASAYLDINANNLGVDLMTLSSHKIYGPKGIAALYVKRETGIKPLIFGGGQEWGLRSSTEAVPLIIGFGEALELSEKLKAGGRKKLEELRNYFIIGLEKISREIRINGPEEQKDRTSHIINAVFPGIENEQLLLHLDKYGIRASAGSACASRGIEPSHVLTAIGLSKEEARSSIRFSLGRQTNKGELDYALKILPKVVKRIKELYPKNLKKNYYR
ncbi:MAG: cysteine desulfurase [Parcubacteria group bacterium]|nr:cysteine desulfurase [Parcubacteria group bacterium]